MYFHVGCFGCWARFDCDILICKPVACFLTLALLDFLRIVARVSICKPIFMRALEGSDLQICLMLALFSCSVKCCDGFDLQLCFVKWRGTEIISDRYFLFMILVKIENSVENVFDSLFLFSCSVCC